MPAESARIVMSDHRVHTFDAVNEFRLNINTGLLTLHYPSGEFGVVIDHLKYFFITVPPQQGDIAFPVYQVMVPGAAGSGAEQVVVTDVIKDSWDTAKGLFMVFGRTMTACFNMDRVLSFQAMKEKA
jgi:hypothetical protein